MIVRAAALAAALALASPALAQPGPTLSGPPPKDGKGGDHGPPVGAAPKRPQLFLSPAGEPFHAPPGAPYPVGVWFAAADADHDGALTLAEFTADFTRFFDRVDTNHDGVIDGFEVTDYEHKIAPEILPRMYRDGDAPDGDQGGPGDGGGRDGGPPGGDSSGGGGPGGGGPPDHGGGRGAGGPGGGMGGPRGGGAGRGGRSGDGAPNSRSLAGSGAGSYSLLNFPEPISSADGDFDGKVTRAEWITAAKRRFKLLDKDGDGRLTLAELPKTPVQIAADAPPKKPKKGLFR